MRKRRQILRRVHKISVNRSCRFSTLHCVRLFADIDVALHDDSEKMCRGTGGTVRLAGTTFLRDGNVLPTVTMFSSGSTQVFSVSSFVMCSPIPWRLVVPRDNTTLANKLLRMSTSHFMRQQEQVSWIPLATVTLKPARDNTSPRNGSVQRRQGR